MGGEALAGEDVGCGDDATDAEASYREGSAAEYKAGGNGKAEKAERCGEKADEEVALKLAGDGDSAAEGAGELGGHENAALRVAEKPLVGQERKDGAEEGGSEAGEDQGGVHSGQAGVVAVAVPEAGLSITAFFKDKFPRRVPCVGGWRGWSRGMIFT